MSHLVCQHLENISRDALEKHQKIIKQYVLEYGLVGRFMSPYLRLRPRPVSAAHATVGRSGNTFALLAIGRQWII